MSVLDEMAKGTRMYHKKLLDLCEPVAQYYGITSMGYVRITNEGRLINLHTNLNWLERCLEKQYYIDDPHMLSPENIDTGFVQWSSYMQDYYLNGMLRDCVEEFNICHGVTYVEKTDFGYELFGFGTKHDNIQIHDKLLTDSVLLQKFIEYLKTKLKPMNDSLVDHQIDFASLKGDTYYTQTGIIPIVDDKSDKVRFLQKIGMWDEKLSDLSFTRRERQAIFHYLQGKTAEQTAQALHLSSRTIEGYMENVKVKLGISSKRELYQKASELNALGLL